MTAIWHLLMLASAGVFLHAGIKFPWFVFFAKDSGLRPKEAPLNMLVAMGFLAFLCIFIGIFPESLYRILPYETGFEPYTAGHVLGQLQLLLYSALAFFVLLKYLQRTDTISLDTDWFYRQGAGALMWLIQGPGEALGAVLRRAAFEAVPGALAWYGRNPVAALRIALHFSLSAVSGPERGAELRKKAREELAAYPGDVTWHWAVGTAVIWITVILLAYLVVYYL